MSFFKKVFGGKKSITSVMLSTQNNNNRGQTTVSC